MAHDQHMKRSATVGKLPEPHTVPKWFDLSLPKLALEENCAMNATSPLRSRVSRMGSTLQLQADAARKHCHTATVSSGNERIQRRSSMTAMHPKRSVAKLPQLPQDSEKYGLWHMTIPSKKLKMADLPKTMSSIDMLRLIQEQTPPVAPVDNWAEPVQTRETTTNLKTHSSTSSMRHFSSLQRISHLDQPGNNDMTAGSTRNDQESDSSSEVESVEEIEQEVKQYVLETEEQPNETAESPMEELSELQPLTKNVQVGNQRRETMAEIVRFADTHLRKKIFRGWDYIEFAFSGGDLSQSQIERVLQSNGISSTLLDVGRIRQVIQEYLAKQHDEENASIETESVHVYVEKKNPMISYAMMREMFYPTNANDIETWKYEMEREKKTAQQEQAERDLQLARVDEKVKRRLASSAQGMIRVLKRFDFMSTRWPSQVIKEATTDQFYKLMFRKRKTILEDPSEATHSNQRSVSHVLNALLQTYARNRGLEDLDLEDAAHVYYDIAANVIQNGARGYFDRKATFWYPERQAFFAFQLKKRMFRLWYHRAYQLLHQRRMLFRKFVAWRFHMIQAKRFREMYRICFWPLYVWKRYVQFVLMSRSKSIFLRLVFETYLELRILRGIKRYVARRNWCRKQVEIRRLAHEAAAKRQVMQSWAGLSRVAARLKKIWEKRGLSLHWQSKHYTIRVALHLWRYYTILRRDITRRKYLCFHGVLVNKNEQWDSENGKIPLTRIMESHLGSRIKLKSHTHELGIAMYIKYRKKDRQAILAMAMVYKRVAPTVYRTLYEHKEYKKRGRFATELGLFRLNGEFFATWVRFLLFRKHQEAIRRASSKRLKEQLTEVVAVKDEPKVESQRALRWREDHEWREAGLIEAAIDAKGLIESMKVLEQERANSSQRYKGRGDVLSEWKRAESRIQQEEENKTNGMRSQLHHCASQILHTRVRRLYEMICRMFDVLQDKYTRWLLKSTFRGLRVPVSMKHTTILSNRAQLRNWIRLAKCFAYWNSNMPRYHSLKLLWSVWRKWIEFIRVRAMYETTGLSGRMRRRRMLLSKFETYLLDQEFMMIPTVLGKKLSYNSFRAVFVRWVEWTQLTIATETMIKNFRARSSIRHIGQLFYAWKVQLKAKYITIPQFKVEKRFSVDMERIRSSLWCKRKHLVSRRIRRVLVACDRKLKLSVCSNPTLKHLFATHSKEIMKRLNLENRLMFVAYNERHIHHFEERMSPIMGGTTGHKFDYITAFPFGHIRQVNVICGKSVDGLSSAIKSFNETIVGKIHGNPFGKSSTFALGPAELLVSVEGYATQSTILGLRFCTNENRFSKWYGRIDAGLYFIVQAERNEEIVGFHGYAAKDSVHGLGVCFRKTTERNVFEGLWIASKSAKLDMTQTNVQVDPINNCDRQFSYFLQMRSCDVYAAMDRSHKLALRMWRSETIQDELRRLRIVMGVCRWIFNALVHGLVALTDKENEGRRILQDGLNIRASGEKMLAEGEAIMLIVDKYREGRKQQLNLALLGFKKIQELRHNIEIGEEKLKRGKKLISEGNSEILRGKQLLPRVPLTDRMMNNIRALYRVVQTKDSMDEMSEGIKKLLLSGSPIQSDTTLVDLKEVAEANDNAAFDMGQARAEVVSSKLRETLTQAIT